MNKKLIALAIVSAISTPAMADSNSVVIYGLLSAGVDSVKNGDGTLDYNTAGTNVSTHNTNRVGRVSDYASRIGFKGSEDLGNGLSGIWQIEQQINTDSNSGGAFGGANLRNTFVGLKSANVGTVLMGTHDTAYKLSTSRLDVFSDTLGDYNSLMGNATTRTAVSANNVVIGSNATAVGASSYMDRRLGNSVVYMTPKLGGFSAMVGYSFGAETALNGANDSGEAVSANVMYETGPLFLTAAYDKQKYGSANTGTFSGTTANPADSENEAWKLGAGFNFGNTTLGVAYEDSDDEFGTNGANVLGHKTWYVSAKHQMGAIALKAAYADADDNATSSSGAKQASVGADYSFSKRTTMYALYTQIKNDTNAAYNFTYNPAAGIGAGDKVSGFSLGMKHAF